jgi:hypothetical protein
LLKKLAGTTRLELATSAVTGQRSNQLNYVPSFVGKLQIQAYDCWADDSPDNLNSLTDDRLAVISARLSCDTNSCDPFIENNERCVLGLTLRALIPALRALIEE